MAKDLCRLLSNRDVLVMEDFCIILPCGNMIVCPMGLYQRRLISAFNQIAPKWRPQVLEPDEIDPAWPKAHTYFRVAIKDAQ